MTQKTESIGKWYTADSFDGERTLKQHYYIPAMRGKFYEDSYLGNRTACLIKGGIVNENEKFINIDEIIEEESGQNSCKKCLKIFHNQQNK